MDKQLIGYYHEHGYNLHVRDEQGSLEQVYEAGNSPHDSSVTVPVDRGLDLETLKRYCEQTGEEMAEEMELPWGGCDLEEVDCHVD